MLKFVSDDIPQNLWKMLPMQCLLSSMMVLGRPHILTQGVGWSGFGEKCGALKLSGWNRITWQSIRGNEDKGTNVQNVTEKECIDCIDMGYRWQGEGEIRDSSKPLIWITQDQDGSARGWNREYKKRSSSLEWRPVTSRETMVVFHIVLCKSKVKQD